MLKKDNFGEYKIYYKFYKCGKNWVIMGIMLVLLGVGIVIMIWVVVVDFEVMNDLVF